MRAVIQRVKYAHITINNSEKRSISKGLVILLGIEKEDTTEDIDWLSRKIARLRIFNDSEGLMNKSLIDIKGEALIVSQFTLHASTKKGNRPSWIKAAPPEIAEPIYHKFLSTFATLCDHKIATGEFGAHMDIELLNDGPVTIIVDSKGRE